MSSFFKKSVVSFLSTALVSVSFSNTALASAITAAEKATLKSASSGTKSASENLSGKVGEMAKKLESGDQNYLLSNNSKALGNEVKNGTQVIGKEGIGVLDKTNSKVTAQYLDNNGNLVETSFDMAKRNVNLGIDKMEVMSSDGKLYVTTIKGIEKLPSGSDLLPYYKPFSKTKMVSDEVNGKSVMKTVSALVGDKDGKILKAEIDAAHNEVKIQRTIGLWHGDSVFKPQVQGTIVSVEPVLEANVVIVKVLDSANNLHEVRHVIDSNILKPAEQAKIDAARAALGTAETIKNALPKLALQKETIKGAATVSQNQSVRGLNLSTSAAYGSR